MKFMQWSLLSEEELIEMNGGETRNSFSVANWFEALCKTLLK